MALHWVIFRSQSGHELRTFHFANWCQLCAGDRGLMPTFIAWEETFRNN